MALIICPECGKQISDTTKVCIHCGKKISSADKIKGNADRESKALRKFIQKYKIAFIISAVILFAGILVYIIWYNSGIAAAGCIARADRETYEDTVEQYDIQTMQY